MISSACFKYVLSILLMPKLDSWKMEKQKSIWDHHHNVCKTKQVEALFIYFFSPPPKKNLYLKGVGHGPWGMFLEIKQSISDEQKTQNGYVYTLPGM